MIMKYAKSYALFSYSITYEKRYCNVADHYTLLDLNSLWTAYRAVTQSEGHEPSVTFTAAPVHFKILN